MTQKKWLEGIKSILFLPLWWSHTVKILNGHSVSLTLNVVNTHDELFQAQWAMWEPMGPQSQWTWTHCWRTDQCRSLSEIEHRCTGWTTVFNFRQGQTLFCPSLQCPGSLCGLPNLQPIRHWGMFLRRLCTSQLVVKCLHQIELWSRLRANFSTQYSILCHSL